MMMKWQGIAEGGIWALLRLAAWRHGQQRPNEECRALATSQRKAIDGERRNEVVLCYQQKPMQ